MPTATGAGKSMGALVVGLALAAAAAAPPAEAAPAPAPLEQRLQNTAYPRTAHMWASWDPRLTPRYDLLVGYGRRRGGAYDVDAIRSRNRRAILLMTPGAVISGQWVHSNLTYGGGIARFPGARDRALGRIAPLRTSELMHDASGRPQSCANFAQPGVPRHVAQILAHEARADGLIAHRWDGISTDNWAHAITEKWLCGSNLDSDRDGRSDAPEVLRRRFHRGLVSFTRHLRRMLPRNAIIGGNGPWYKPETWRGPGTAATRLADHAAIEHMEKWLDRPEEFIRTARRWERTRTGRPRPVSALMGALDSDNRLAPKGVLESDADVQRSCRWGLSLALMTSAYYQCWPQHGHGAWWWLDEYDGGQGIRRRGYLGRPTTAARRIDRGVWRRDFTRGVAITNSTDKTQTIHLGPGHRTIRGRFDPEVNDGTEVTSVRVGPYDGRVVLRTANR